MPRPSTFSIVAYDPEEQAFGVAVASKFLAAAAVVSWAEAGVGAVATQALAKVSFGEMGLGLMAQGISAPAALETLVANDPGSADRQIGMVDLRGRAAAHTGEHCYDWAGHIIGEGFTCQGNILAGPQVVEAMATAYTGYDGPLAARLLAALRAGDDSGGDKRGKQSAGLLVVKPNGGYGGDNDRFIDLRVDDDPEPVRRLAQLYDIHQLLFGEPRAEDQVPIDTGVATELQQMLVQGGYYQGAITGQWDEPTRLAFRALIGNENLEERWSVDDMPDTIDRVALEYLRGRYNGG